MLFTGEIETTEEATEMTVTRIVEGIGPGNVIEVAAETVVVVMNVAVHQNLNAIENHHHLLYLYNNKQ